MPQDNERRRKLYDRLSEAGYYTKPYEDFNAVMDDPERGRKLYGKLSEAGFYTKPYEEFNSAFGPQKSSFQQPLRPMTAPASGVDGGALSGGLGTPSDVSQQPPTASVSPGPQGTQSEGTPPLPESVQPIRLDEAGDQVVDMPAEFLTRSRQQALSKIVTSTNDKSVRDDAMRQLDADKAIRARMDRVFAQKQEDRRLVDTQESRDLQFGLEPQPVPSMLPEGPATVLLDPREQKVRADYMKSLTPEQTAYRTSKQEAGAWTDRDAFDEDVSSLTNAMNVLDARERRLLRKSEFRKAQQQTDALGDVMYQNNDDVMAEANDIDLGRKYVYERLATAVRRHPEYASEELQRSAKTLRADVGSMTDPLAYNVAQPIRFAIDKFAVSMLTTPRSFGSAEYGLTDQVAEWAENSMENIRADEPSAFRGNIIEEGKVNPQRILPKVVETIGQAALLMGTSPTRPALLASSFVQTNGDYYKDARDKGLTNEQAQKFAWSAAALTSALELASPNDMARQAIGGTLRKEITDGLAQGLTTKEILRKAALAAGKEALPEMAQESGQYLGDKGAAYLANRILGSDKLDDQVKFSEFTENALLGGVVGSIAGGGTEAMRLSSIEQTAKNPQKVAQAAEAMGNKTALENVDRIVNTYAGNGLGAIPPQNAAKAADAIMRKEDVKQRISAAPMDPTLEAVQGDPRKKEEIALTMEAMTAMGIEPKKAVLALAGQGMLDMPEGAKVKKSADGTVDIEVKEPKEGEKGITKKEVIDDLEAQVKAILPDAKKVVASVFTEQPTGEEPTGAPTEVPEGGDAVTSVAPKPVTNEERTTTEAPAAAPAEDTGAPASVPAPEQPTTEPVANTPERHITRNRQYVVERGEDGQVTVKPSPDYKARPLPPMPDVDAPKALVRLWKDQKKKVDDAERQARRTALIEYEKEYGVDTGRGHKTPIQKWNEAVADVTTRMNRMSDQNKDARLYALQFLLNGGKINFAAAKKELGSNARTDLDKLKKNGILVDDPNENSLQGVADALAESMAEQLGTEVGDAGELRTALIDALGHGSRSGVLKAMTDILDKMPKTKDVASSDPMTAMTPEDWDDVNAVEEARSAFIEYVQKTGGDVDLANAWFDDQVGMNRSASFDYETPERQQQLIERAEEALSQLPPDGTETEAGATDAAPREVDAGANAGGVGKAQDAEEQRLAAEAKRARAERDRFVADWNERGQGLFAPEEGMAQQTIDGGFDNSQENFDAKVEPLNEKVRQADKALADYVNNAASRAQAAAQQTSIGDQIRSFKIKTDGTAGSYIIPPQILNGALEVAALFADAGSTIAEAGQKAIDYVRGTEWFRSLSSKDKTSAIDQLRELLDKPRRGPLSQNQVADDEDIMPLRQVGDAIGGLMEMDDYGDAYDAAVTRTIDLIQEARSKLSVTNVNAVLDKALAFAREEVQFVREEQGALDANEQEVWKRVFQALKALKEDPSIGRSVVRTLSPRTEKGGRVIDDSEAFPRNHTTYQTKARKAAAALEKAKLKGDQLYALPLPPSVWNGAIRAMQEVIIAGGKAVDAIAAAIKHIQASDWWKNKATQEEKDQVTTHLQGRVSDLEKAIAAEDVVSLKDNIKKASAAAVKGERSNQREARKEFVQKVRNTLKELTNRLSPTQVRAITASAARRNPASDRSVAAFVRHAERIMANAQYAADVEKAKDYRKKAKKMSKRESVPLNHKEVLASMARMDVGALPDPAAFNAIAEQYMQQFAPMTQGYVPQSSADTLDALAKMHESAAEERFKERTEDADDALAGAMAAESADEFAEGIDEDAKEKLRDEMADMAEDAKFSITEQFDEEDLTGKERGIVKKLMEADIQAMSLDQMREYIKTVDNIGINGSFDGAAKVAAMVEGVASVSKAREAVAGTPLRRAWTGNIGSFFQQQFSSTSGLFRFLFGMGEGMAKFHNALGATDLELAKKKYDDAVRDIKEKMSDFYTAHRKKHKNADSAETIAAEAMIAFAVQPVRGYDAQQSFDIQKRIIEQNIERLGEKEKTAKEAELWQKAYDSMLKDAKTREDLLAKAKKTSPAAYESVMFLKDKVLAPYTDLLRAHKEQFWGEDFGENDMYLPITYRFFGKQEDLEPSKQGVFASDRVEKPKEAANLIGRKGVTSLPAGMVISPNLRRNVLTSSSRNLYDAYTSEVWQRINQFFKTPGAASVVGGSENLDYLNFGLKTLQAAQRREGGGAQDKMDRAVGALIQRARKYASHLALGGIRQFLQQPADQLTNAVVNVGPQLVGRSITQVNKARPVLALSSIGDRGELIGGTNWDNTLEAEMASLARSLQGGLVDRFDASTEKIQRAIMFALTKSDVAAARTAWIAYYTKYIEENGGELMDWQKEADAIKNGDEFRREALAYATVNTDVTQGSSDPTKMARIAQHGGNSWQSLAKGVFNPFSSFTIGMRERITNDVADLLYGGNMYDENGEATPHGERAQRAARSLTATIAANAAFTAIRIYVVKAAITAGAEGLRALMQSAFGGDDDEKDDAENRLAMLALIFNMAHTMKMMDADIYRTVAEAYKQEKRENSDAPTNTDQEEAIKKAKLAYTSLLQSLMVSGYTPFIEAGSVDAINRMGYYIQLLGSDPARTNNGTPMKYESWVKEPENPPLYRTGQGYDSGDYGVMSVITDKLGSYGDQAQELFDTANDTPERKEERKVKEQKKERMSQMDAIADQVASGAMTWDEAMKHGREQLEKDGVKEEQTRDPQGEYINHLKSRIRYDRAPQWVKDVIDEKATKARVKLARKKLDSLSGEERVKEKQALKDAHVWTDAFDAEWARTK